jgi:hypothetical protein
MTDNDPVCHRCSELEARLTVARHALKLIEDLAWFREKAVLDPHEIFHLVQKALRECKSPSSIESSSEKLL